MTPYGQMSVLDVMVVLMMSLNCFQRVLCPSVKVAVSPKILTPVVESEIKTAAIRVHSLQHLVQHSRTLLASRPRLTIPIMRPRDRLRKITEDAHHLLHQIITLITDVMI